MSVLEDYRFHPGKKLLLSDRSRVMVLHLCAGMIRDGTATGGLRTVAVANLQNGKTSYEDNQTEVLEELE